MTGYDFFSYKWDFIPSLYCCVSFDDDGSRAIMCYYEWNYVELGWSLAPIMDAVNGIR